MEEEDLFSNGVGFESSEEVEILPTFGQMGLNSDLMRGIYSYGFMNPSPIQQRAIRQIVRGQDFIAQTPKGSGKTVAYAIAVLQTIDVEVRETQALILVPIHELAVQIEKLILALGDYMKVQCYACTGRTNVQEDIFELRLGQHVVVGTPGRVFDLIRHRKLHTRAIKMVIFDEAGELLTGGFKDRVRYIYVHLPPQAQTVLISANIPTKVIEMIGEFMTAPLLVLAKGNVTFQDINQFYIKVDRVEWKFDTICDLYDVLPITQAIIFCNTRHMVDWLAGKMREAHFTVSSVHADMELEERDEIIKQFRAGESRTFIGTDECARALVNIPQVSLVINCDMPTDRELYMHRICRFSYGRVGLVINLVNKEQIRALRDIELHYNTEIKELPMCLDE